MARYGKLCMMLALLLAAGGTAQAQDPAQAYPDRAVRLVVPFSAGSMTDILARSLADKLGETWKQQVIVENRPGLAGTSSVAKSTADGYTLILTSNGHAVISSLNKNIAFDPIKDFATVSQVASMPVILVAPPEAPTRTVKELIEAARAKPGALNYGSAGLGSSTSIAAEIFKQVTATDMVHVAYRGLPESQTSVIRGDSAMAFTFYNVGGDLVQSGKMRGLAVSGAERLKGLPDVPTFKEAGLPDYVYDPWFGVMAPAGTPKSIVAKVSQDIAQALAQPDMKQRFLAQGVDLKSSAPDQFEAALKSDTERYGKLFKAPN
jgi:tripartite-type tricarboxylate transporter receptor subunit TctC